MNSVKLLLSLIMVFPFFLFAQEICNNGIDDNGNGLIDLNDPECICNLTQASIIPNPSFEDTLCCPSDFSQLECAAVWAQATDATSDYFNCGYTFFAAQFAGLNPPPDGSGYVGAIFTQTNIGDVFFQNYYEYVGACLLSPMMIGENYTLRLQIASSPISGVGDVCNNAVITHGPIDITIYGLATCPSFPISANFDCPPGWTVIGSTNYTPQASWSELTFSIQPNFNVEAIMIGAPCTLPPSYIVDVNSEECYPYFYFDNLLLGETGAVSITPAGLFCLNNLQLTGSETDGASYQWYLNGVALVGQTNPILNVSGNNLVAGTYTFTSIVNGVCTAAEYDVFNTEAIPNANFTFNAGCANEQIQFVNQTTISTGTVSNYSWNFGDGSSSVSQESPNHVFNTAGTFTVTLTATSNQGCTNSVTQNISITEPAFVELNDIIKCIGESIILAAIEFPQNTAYVWNNGETTPQVLISQGGTYIVTASNNCSSYTDSAFVLEIPCNVEFPNVFSPNGDGANDNFTLILPEGISDFNIVILNRWGIEIQSFDTANFAWDGNDKAGNKMSEGVYFYHAKGALITGEVFEKHGFIHLVW